MRTCMKIIAASILLVTVYACSKKVENVFIEKDGTEYKVGDQVSFYYPKTFEMDTSIDNKKMVSFKKEDEVISYSTIKDDSDNMVEEMPALYAGQLEEDGSIDVAYKNVTIQSGLKCQEFTGSLSTGLYFKHMAYFTADATYVVSYVAPKQTYEENIPVISKYLESLTVHREQVS